MTIKHAILLFASVFALVGCSANMDSSPVSIIRLDQTISRFQNLDSAQQENVIDSLRPEFEAFSLVTHIPELNRLNMLRLSRGEVIEAFQPDVDSVFPSLENLERQLGHILAMSRLDSLDIPEVGYAAVVWGQPKSIVITDSVVLIALNHYLGSDYPGYSHWEAYQRANKKPDILPYNIAEAIVASRFPMEGRDSATLLQNMLYEGAIVQALMRIVPDADLSLALGCMQDDLDYLEENLDRMWIEIGMQKMLNSSNPSIISGMIYPGPFSPLLQGEAPSRAGRFIGYKIVDAYIKNHLDTSLRQLLSPNFYNNSQSLINSGF